jgi:hypothetical protein
MANDCHNNEGKKMMYISVTRSIFHDAFQSCRPDQFTYFGLNSLFDYLDDMDQADMYELDVIAICCEFTQYDNINSACQAYGLTDQDELENNTIVIECDDDTVIVQDY